MLTFLAIVSSTKRQQNTLKKAVIGAGVGNSPMTSQRTYMHDMTPMNRTYETCISECYTPLLLGKYPTKYRNAILPATNQNKMINPDIPRINNHVLFNRWPSHSILGRSLNSLLKDTHSQLFLAHHSVTKKNAPITIEATLLALVSNPHAIRHAPMNEDPK